jgi:hypothetical protein
MVQTVIGMTPFHGQEVLGLFHYTDLGSVPRPGTDSAGVIFSNAVTGGTESHPLDHLPQTFGQGHGVFGGFQQMKGEP